jgi:antitoxin (DNA-binding transcriptional repressor) of toxin-antitoxin stability system
VWLQARAQGIAYPFEPDEADKTETLIIPGQAAPIHRRLISERHSCYDLLHLLRSTVMTRSITQRELRNDSAAVLREVQGGQILTVTRNGVAVAELRPVPPRRFVQRTVIAEAARSAPRVDLARFRADLDAVVDPSIDG